MPAAVTTAIALWEGFAAANALAAFIIKTAVTFAISSLLTPKQDNNNFQGPLSQQAAAQTLSLTQSAANWEIVYGQVRKGGRYVFRTVTDQPGAQQWTELYVVPTDAPYTVRVNHADLFNAEVSADVISVVINDETEEYSYAAVTPTQSAGVYTFTATEAGQHVRIIYTANNGASSGKYLHLVLVLAAHSCLGIPSVYFDDEEVTLDGSGDATGKYAGHVYVAKHLGGAGDPVDPVLNAAVPTVWTSACTLEGHCYLYLRLLKNNNLFPGGVPNISALVNGKDTIYDPRTATYGWSSNSALCIADYMASESYGMGAAYTTRIDDAALIAAANVCDEVVDVIDGDGTEARYHCNGVVDTGVTPSDNIGRMLGSMAGRMVYVNGLWKIHAGAYVSPTLTLDEGDLAGPLKVTPRLSRRDAFNGVKGTYVSPVNNWQASDFPAVQDSDYVTEDNGEVIWKDIELPFTITSSVAQRLARIELERARRQITVIAPFKTGAYRAEPPNVIGLTNARRSWSAKPFEIGELKLNFGEAMSVEYTLRETDADVYG